MNQRPLRGVTTLEALQRAYFAKRAQALRICEELDRRANHASGKDKLAALIETLDLLKRVSGA